ncbi:MAG: hypothetical protein IKJ27_00245 [Clostridia bacterium]|nr:hypothetical protein [Clostridia bacterium]
MKRKSLFEDENSSYQKFVKSGAKKKSSESLFEDENSSYSHYVIGEKLKEAERSARIRAEAVDKDFLNSEAYADVNSSSYNQAFKEYREVKAALDDYNSYIENRRISKMSLGELDAVIADYDEKIASHKNYVKWDKGWLPGGLSPDEASYHKDEMNKLENESAKYRTRRDYVKAQEVTGSLPADVVELLDKYNNILYSQQGTDFSQIASAFMGAGGEGGGNRVQYSSNENIKNHIAKELAERGYENFSELAEYRKYITDVEFTDEYTQRWEDFTKEHPVASSVLNLAMAPARMVTSSVGALDGIGNQSDLGFNPYNPYYALTHANNAKQSVIIDSFDEGIISKDAKTFLYNTAESAVESILSSVAFGGGGGAVLGLGAFGDTVLGTVEKGGNYEDALFSGILAGTFEGLFETVSIGQLKAFKDIPVNSLKDVLRNIGSGVLVNASEETLTELANVMSDYMINGGVSDYYNAVVAYMDDGMGEAEAKRKAAGDIGSRIFEAGVSGGLMGAGFGAGGSAVSYGKSLYNRYESGKGTVEGGQLGTLVDGAADVQGDDKYKSLYESVVKSQQAAEKDADYDYSMKEYYKVGKLSERLAETTESERNSIVRSAVSDRFKSLGETGDINILSSAVTKTVFGEKLTHKEKAALKDSKHAQQVINEAGDVYGEYSSAWVDKTKADVDALYERRYSPETAALSESTETKKYSDENYVNRVKETVIEKGQNKDAFDKQFDLFLSYGRQGVDFDTVKDTVPESAGVSERQLKAAYDLGAELDAQSKLDVVTGISSVKGGEVYVTTTAGNTRKLSELNVEAATGQLVRSASKYDKDTANAFIRGYNRSATVSSYARAFDAFYSAGVSSSDAKYSDVLEKNKSLIKYMDNADVARKAFDMGRAERTKADKAIKQKKQTGAHPAKGTYQSKTVSVGEEAVDEFYSALAKKTGIDIDRVHNILNNKKQVANAQYDPTKHKMTVSASAQNELQASVHELTHAAFAYNTEKMKPVKKAVIDYFLSQNSESEFEEILRQYGASYEGDSRADIEEEFVADALGGMFTTEEGVQDFLNWLQEESGYKAEEKKTILQRITEWLNDIIEAIRDIMNSGELNGAGKFFAKENCDELVRIRKQFLEALDGAGVNYREGGAVEGNVKFSNKRLTNGTETAYNNDNEYLTMANRAKPNARSSINWVYQQELFSFKENKLFFEKISEINQGSGAFIQNLDGEYMLPIGNKIVFTNGDYDTPYISKVIEVMTEYDTRFEEVRRLVFDYEKGLRSNFANETRIFKNMYGHGYIYEYNSGFNGAYEMGDGKRKRKNRKSIIENYFKSQNRGRNAGNGNKELRSGSDEKRVKFSLPLSNLNDLHRSTIDKVTELGKVTAQMQAHILRIGSNLTKRELSALKIQEIARKLKVDYASKLDIHDLSGRLTELYTLINEGGASYDVLRAHLDDIKERLLKESKYMKPDISEAAKERLREIRKTPVSINETQLAEILSMYGNMTNFRRYTGLQITKDGTPLEMRWSEWADMSGMFDPEISDADMPIRLAEIVDSLKNTYEDESGYDLDSARDQLDADICAAYLEIPTVSELGNRFFEIEQELLTELKEQRDLYTSTFNKTYALARKAAKNDFDRQLVNAKARMEQRVQNIADTRLREKKRNRLIKTVKRLDRLLRNPGKGAPSAGVNKYDQEYVHLTNIPEEMKRTVIDFCSVFIDNDAGVFTGKYTDSENVVRKKINELRKQYQNLKQSESYIGTSVSDEMTAKLEKLHDIVADKRLAQLTAAELDMVNEIADHLMAVINNEVKMWVNGKQTKVADIGKSALNELAGKGMKGYIQAMKGIDKLSVMNLKPIYFFEKVGGILEMLWKDILGGQDKYVRNMQFAQQRFSDIAKKYHLDRWTDDKAETFTTAQGHEISLTRGQALLIWATWKREGKAGKDSKHLFEGGIVYPDTVKKASEKGKKGLPEVLQKVYEDGTAHRIRVEDMLKIDEWLTDEQKKYADELVSFLSTDIGAWGNEISMQLYGVNKFNEKYYIPFNSAKNYLYKGMGEEGTKLLKSEGFTNETKWGASNPLVVDDFTNVVVKHIERMSMYNSMVIPLDNFSRVWNYQERANAESNESMKDVKAVFATAWGEEYKKYVDNLLRDINGGVMGDTRELGDKWLSKFKKAAVMGSLSVMIQQPSAIVRAMSEVDVKYFVSSSFGQRKAAYEEAMKYAPVAVLKEIGGFDTVSGQSMADWMLKREYKGMDKLKAFFKDSQFRDDVLSWGPAWADRVTWAHIWLACKNEVRVKNSLTGEALLEATGKRFTEVINKTQVYDSVLSRSAAMRSNTVYMKMITAFMAEPTTSLNMLMSGVDKLKTPDTRKKGAGMIASVATAQLLNSILVSFIYAARDDDEEKGYWEVWSGDFVDNFLNGLNPLTMIPIVKDIFSLISGYSVDRSDMTVISNFVDSINAWRSDNKSIGEKISGTVGSVADLFGIPLKNLIRDVKAVINVHNKVKSGSDSTFVGALTEMRDSVLGVVDPIGFIDNSNDRHLYNAWVKGNKDFYEEYASRYKSGSSIKSALENQIEERYVKGKLDYDEAFELYRKLGYSENEATYKLRELEEPVEDEEAEDKYADFYSFDGAGGIQDKADAEREEERQQAAEKDEEYSEDSDYKWLDEALGSGNLKDIETETKYLIDKGVSESDVNSHVSGWLKKNDTDVIAAGNEYAIGDFSTFESTVKLIAERYGVSEAVAAKAVRSVAGESGKEIEGTIYVNADLHKAIEFGNDTVSKKIASAIIEAKTQQYITEGKNSYEAQKSARSAVRQSINSKWKETYQKADPATRVQIWQHMYATGAYDYLGQLDDTLKKWRTEWEEEQRKK